ncbi:hypothetical protein S83_066318, partial [Arachis hypogaea]
WKGCCRGTVNDDTRSYCAWDNNNFAKVCGNGWFLIKSGSHGVKLLDIAPAVTPPTDSLKRFLDANPVMYLGDEPKELHFREKLPPSRSWLYYNNYNPNMDGDDMPHLTSLEIIWIRSPYLSLFDDDQRAIWAMQNQAWQLMVFAPDIFLVYLLYENMRNDCGIWVAEWMILNHYWGVNKPW